jgi:hypothetical protein
MGRSIGYKYNNPPNEARARGVASVITAAQDIQKQFGLRVLRGNESLLSLSLSLSLELSLCLIRTVIFSLATVGPNNIICFFPEYKLMFRRISSSSSSGCHVLLRIKQNVS